MKNINFLQKKKKKKGKYKFKNYFLLTFHDYYFKILFSLKKLLFSSKLF